MIEFVRETQILKIMYFCTLVATRSKIKLLLFQEENSKGKLNSGNRSAENEGPPEIKKRSLERRSTSFMA